jgi:hypothetical protein
MSCNAHCIEWAFELIDAFVIFALCHQFTMHAHCGSRFGRQMQVTLRNVNGDALSDTDDIQARRIVITTQRPSAFSCIAPFGSRFYFSDSNPEGFSLPSGYVVPIDPQNAWDVVLHLTKLTRSPLSVYLNIDVQYYQLPNPLAHEYTRACWSEAGSDEFKFAAPIWLGVSTAANKTLLMFDVPAATSKPDAQNYYGKHTFALSSRYTLHYAARLLTATINGQAGFVNARVTNERTGVVVVNGLASSSSDDIHTTINSQFAANYRIHPDDSFIVEAIYDNSIARTYVDAIVTVFQFSPDLPDVIEEPRAMPAKRHVVELLDDPTPIEENQEQGNDEGNDQGTDEGNDEGNDQGNDEGTDQGNDEGNDQGNDQGTDEGNDEGNDQGTDQGNDEGTDQGNDEGTDQGNDQGTDQGNEGGIDIIDDIDYHVYTYYSYLAFEPSSLTWEQVVVARDKLVEFDMSYPGESSDDAIEWWGVVPWIICAISFVALVLVIGLFVIYAHRNRQQEDRNRIESYANDAL